MTKLEIPASGDAITVDWMERALRAGGAIEVPALQEVIVRDIGSGVGLLGEIVRCRLVPRDGAASIPPTVVVKLPGRESKSRRMSRLQSLYKREYFFYRHVAPHAPIRSPRLLYGDYEERSDRFVLVLDDLGRMEAGDQVQGATPAQARCAVRAIAKLHGCYWDRVEQLSRSGAYDFARPAYRYLIQATYLAFLVPALERFGSLFSDETRRLAEAYGTRIADHLAASRAFPRTFIHGDFRLDNLFFGTDDPDDIAAVDWQVSGIGFGLFDVMYFLATNVDVAVRREIERDLLAEYAEIVRGMGAKELTDEDCWLFYRNSALALLLVTVFVAGGLDLTNDRSRQLCEISIRRTMAAIEDLDAGEFLPPAAPKLSVSGIVSGLSHTAFRAYRACRAR